MPKIISLHDVLEPLKQALLASRDVIISGQICGSKLQRVFTLRDGCWLPKKSRTQKALFLRFRPTSRGCTLGTMCFRVVPSPHFTLRGRSQGILKDQQCGNQGHCKDKRVYKGCVQTSVISSNFKGLLVEFLEKRCP